MTDATPAQPETQPDELTAGGGGRIRPRTASNVTDRDVEAVKKMNTYRADQLERIQTRAEKWIAGMGAIVGVLAAAVVIKGPDSFSKLAVWVQRSVVALIVLGGAFIAWGIWFGYKAAHGDPLNDSDLQDLVDEEAATTNEKIVGAAERWETAVRATYQAARESLANAALATVAGTILLGGAILITWIAPATSPPDRTFCLETVEGTVQLQGDVPKITEGQMVLQACE